MTADSVGGSKTKGRKRPGLTLERIVDEALALVDAEGLDALTTRALARRFGVEAMALYHHVPSKDALLDAMTERLEREARPAVVAGDWRARLRAMADAQLATALRHPRAAELMTSRRGTTDAVFDNNELVLACLEEAGLVGEQRVVWLRAYAAFVNGVMGYFTATAGGAAPPALDAARHPRVIEAVRAGAQVPAEATLDAGLAAIVAGICAARP